ncbi:MAG: hypothetical protein JXB13_01155, partial [Phycisphaerae bacterium]|nr:hypothetical protein [Phycisphaerae bacterium]
MRILRAIQGVVASLSFVGALFWTATPVRAVTFTTNTQIACTDATYDGQDIVVDGCTLTVDCDHAFNSLTVINGGVVTHTAGGAVPPGRTDSVGMHLTIATDLTIDATSSISANGKGYGPESGPGAGSSGYSGSRSGAGYGG